MDEVADSQTKLRSPRRQMAGKAGLLLMMAVLLVGGCTADDVPIPVTPQPEREPQTLQVGSEDRQYEIHVPETGSPGGGWPLVIVLHGLGSNAGQIRGLTAFDELADDEGFLAVYPEGLARAWLDAGIVGQVSDTDIAARNLRFIEVLIDEIDREYGVDARRVYLAGLSNGGMFAYHAACHLSGRLVAVGLVASASISQSFDSCEPEHPVAYIAFHGTSDIVVPYEGGEVVPGFERLGEFQSAPEAAEFWAEFNGCSTEPVREELPDVDARDTSIAYRDVWATCAGERAVALVTLDGAGHSWPGHPPRSRRLGSTNLDIDATRMLWEFFDANPKPAGS